MKINRRDLLKLGAYSTILITSSGLHGCNSDDSDDYSFNHGVASGDPLEESVVIWTRVTPGDAKRVTVNWQVATDADFEELVNEDYAEVDADRDFTVKVDVQGLESNRVYYYRFMAGSVDSPVGRTKTLPSGSVDQAAFAVLSCSNYPAGYFNVYRELANTEGLDAVVHLGDYIYEYGRTDEEGEPAYASEDAATLGREVEPATELLSLSDYRTRYAQYRTDADLQAVHARHPFIVVWDDHEIANDAYVSGAENHDEATEGSYSERKQAAIQAFFEWLPLRPLTPDAEGRIYRRFEFGNLVNLLMLDTRIIGRDIQLNYADYIDATTGEFDSESFTIDMSSSDRTLLGASQLAWLTDNMNQSTATWQVLGQQVLMMNMQLPAVTLMPDPGAPTVSLTEYGEIATAAITYQTLVENGVDGTDSAALIAAGMTAEQLEIVNDPVRMAYLDSPFIPYNLDAWDGYAYERELLLANAKAGQKNLISLAGDTHNAWAGRLTDSVGDSVGIEFATTSVSSPGLEEYLAIETAEEVRGLEPGVTQLVSDLDYCNLRERGLMIMTFTPQQATAEWRFVDSIKQQDYQIVADLGKTLTLAAGSTTLT
ncbi:MAG: alkaline phosphatase D family protein [Candidatus Thiodiazotropha sp. 6PLUC9]